MFVFLPPHAKVKTEKLACCPPHQPPFYKFISNSLSLKCSLLWSQLYGRFSPISLPFIIQLFTIVTVNDALHSFIVKFSRIELVSYTVLNMVLIHFINQYLLNMFVSGFWIYKNCQCIQCPCCPGAHLLGYSKKVFVKQMNHSIKTSKRKEENGIVSHKRRYNYIYRNSSKGA